MRKRARHGAGSVVQVGRRWRARWREDGRRRSTTFANKEVAQQALSVILGNIARGRPGLPEHAVAQAELLETAVQRTALGEAFADAELYARAELGTVALASRRDVDDLCDVYLIADRSRDVVKIGQSALEGATGRLRTLQTANSCGLELLVAVPGVRGLSEATLHSAFRHARVKGEWFLLTARIIQFADFMRFAWNRERAAPDGPASRLPLG